MAMWMKTAHNQPREADQAKCLLRSSCVAPTASEASPNVRYAFNSDRICASQRTDAKCQQLTSGEQDRRSDDLQGTSLFADAIN